MHPARDPVITLAGNRLELLPARAAWWPARHALVVADVHLGKGAHFRARGYPVPSGDTRADLSRLEALVRDRNASELWILGDLFHTRAIDGLYDDFARWRRAVPGCRVVLVRGNHDRNAELPDAWDMEAVDDAMVDGISLQHAPDESPGTPTMAGHVHPALSLGSRSADSLRVPVFWLREAQLVLPAFGTFTGGYRIRPQPADRVFAIGPDDVVEIRRRASSHVS